MKYKFKPSELIFRVPVLFAGLWLVSKWIWEGNFNLLLTFFVGAACWEYGIFFLIRTGIVDRKTLWKEEEETKEDE